MSMSSTIVLLMPTAAPVKYRLRARPPPAAAEAVELISELYAEGWTAPKKGGAARSR
jgi:hypothetical protein